MFMHIYLHTAHTHTRSRCHGAHRRRKRFFFKTHTHTHTHTHAADTMVPTTHDFFFKQTHPHPHPHSHMQQIPWYTKKQRGTAFRTKKHTSVYVHSRFAAWAALSVPFHAQGLFWLFSNTGLPILDSCNAIFGCYVRLSVREYMRACIHGCVCVCVCAWVHAWVRTRMRGACVHVTCVRTNVGARPKFCSDTLQQSGLMDATFFLWPHG
jgi:hypothetical protein